MKKIRILTCLASATLLAAWGEPPLEGKWEVDSDNQMALEFVKGGTLIMSNHGRNAAGSWEKLDATRLLLRMTAPLLGNVNQVCNFRIASNVLEISACDYAARLNRKP